ncbi:MAG: hypothetical protein AB3N11_11280 [Arenibacterium sp.]
MKIKTRFIKSVTQTAKTLDHKLPWQRGAARAERIARREASIKQAMPRHA